MIFRRSEQAFGADQVNNLGDARLQIKVVHRWMEMY